MPHHTTHAHLPDDPPVAATESGGPLTSPGVLDPAHKYTFESVPGLFLQTGEPKHVQFEDLHPKSFGLLDRSPARWTNLRAAISKLQADAPPGVQYKVLFLARHGQGWHNFAAGKYGYDPWEEHYTYLTTDGDITWGPDPELTPLGHAQTKAVHDVWVAEQKEGAPVNIGEMRWIVSPLQRTCQTMVNQWGDMLGVPEVWEDFREIYGGHTCDKRSSKTTIMKRFPFLRMEAGFSEEDELWKPDERETDAHIQHRTRRAMDRIFDGAVPETYISITGHGAAHRNLLAVLGHQAYPLATGEMIPVVVRATLAGGAECHGE